MRIGIDMGHTLTGEGTGAVGVVKETDKNREVGKRLIAMLQEKGHTVYNCTVDKSSNDLADRVAKANKQPLDLFVSLHLNCYSNSSAHGVETFSYATTGKGNEYAKAIQHELVKAIGWYDRGKKEANFYVLRKTNASAVLVELGFCSNPLDMAKWNTEVIAKALFKGITGKEYVSNSKPQAPTKPNTPNGVYRVVVASYANKSNAEEMQDKLKKAGFNSFLVFYENK